MSHSKDQLDLLAQAAEEIANLNLVIAEATERKTHLLEVFKNEENGIVPRKEPYKFGRAEVKVTTNVRLDDGAAQRELSVSDYKKVSKTTLDTTKARKILSEEQIKAISTNYANKIEVRIP